MAKSSSGETGSFDLDRFRKLLQLMEKYGVTETQLTKDGESWKVRRGPKQIAVAPESVAVPAVTTAPAPAVTPAEATPVKAPAGRTIDAPTVGTFYSAANPEDDPFVTVGSTVGAETVVCIIEAMKVFNQIPAEVSGKVVEILVENGDPVEFGQPLFRIE